MSDDAGTARGEVKVVLPSCREVGNAGGHGCGDAEPSLFGCTYKYGSGVRWTVCIDCRREDGLLRVSDEAGAGSDTGKGAWAVLGDSRGEEVEVEVDGE